ncbi:MAG: hypothetical protein IE918_03290 [Campylobacterales bacterium]|nr:hypothetical protein [Campylobacterales bacterium]
MIRQFIGLAALLMVVTGMAAGHYLSADGRSHKKAFSDVVAVTGLVSPSLSTAFYEPAFLGEEVEHPASPQMQSLNRMEFVYAE